MSGEDNLSFAMWGQIAQGKAALLSPRTGAGLRHGISMCQIVSTLKHISFTPHFLRRSSRIALDDNGVVLLGNPQEFCPDARRLLDAAGYPGRFEVIPTGAGAGIRDRQEEPDRSFLASAERHFGLVYRAQAHDLTGRPTLLLAGTTPLGILAVAMWVTQPALAGISMPPLFPQRPIEALVRLPYSGQSLPALNNVETVRLICGNAEYDPLRREWKEAVRRTPIQLLKEAGVPRVIFVGEHRLEVSETDLSRLLLLLILRTEKGHWTTMAEAQRRLDGREIPNRIRTLAARRSELLRLSPDPDFLETMTSGMNDKPAYRLRADIVVVDTDAVGS